MAQATSIEWTEATWNPVTGSPTRPRLKPRATDRRRLKPAG